MPHLIGTLKDKELAQVIVTELDKQGFTPSLEQNGNGDFNISIENLVGIEEAKYIFAQYLGLMPRYISRHQLQNAMTPKPALLKKALISKNILIFCCLVFVIQTYFHFTTSDLNDPEKVLKFEHLFLYSDMGEISLFSSLQSVEIWRVITPIFLHFGILHILFNGLALKDFGPLSEISLGKKGFVGLILISGVFSNTVQYLMTGPMFGGFSGVIYALLGQFIGWQLLKIPSPVNIPRAGFIWLLICFFITFIPGPMSMMANGAHLTGFFIGFIYGSLYLIIFSRINLKRKAELKRFLTVFTLVTIIYFTFMGLEVWRLGWTDLYYRKF